MPGPFAYSRRQLLGRFPWLAPPFLRSRRLRARFDIGVSSYSVGGSGTEPLGLAQTAAPVVPWARCRAVAARAWLDWPHRRSVERRAEPVQGGPVDGRACRGASPSRRRGVADRVSTLADLVAEHTGLPHDAVDHLQRVVAEWQLLSDLSFADFLFWVPVTEARRAGRRFLCVAQARPTTAATAHPEDMVGGLHHRERAPAAAQVDHRAADLPRGGPAVVPRDAGAPGDDPGRVRPRT